uniref:SUEL-type lectin domain-containing protein n=1 Tax=Magallana gigas TaxID=29159 RepID=A0A8W8JG13_MAGGI
MTSWIRASLIFLQILGQVCRVEFKYCQEAVDNVEIVTSCPTSEQEWESAANRKNCQSTAAQQTCSEPETFLYHCVINGYGNETIEVCAPRRLMIGYCTEFNVAGGVIQSHVLAPCNKTSVLRCDDVYYSTQAYKFLLVRCLVSKLN